VSVSRIYSSKPVSQEVNDALNAMCADLGSAIDQAKDAGVPQGLVVAILSGLWHEETARMLAIRDAGHD
jgi:hypothetical protein|tara:strand:+ start:864 stop:1070 length:207 start_codon:yes stop_codon:yes gene_type:complete